MRIVIIGLGGVGGFFGALLAGRYASDPEHEVIFVCRGTHGEVIREKGLTLITIDGETFSVKPDVVTDDPAGIGKADMVIFAVKGYDLQQAALSVAPVVKEDTVVISLLNGVNNAALLSELLPGAKILNGCVYISSRMEEPGVVRHVGGPAKIFFGPEDGKIDPYGLAEKILRDAAINAELTDRIELEVWRKFMFMSPFAGVTTLKGETFGEVLASGGSFELLKGMMEELEQLGRFKGVDLPSDIVSLSIETGRKFPPETKSSMQLDFEKGKRNELETFIGYVVRECREAGIEAPDYTKTYEGLSSSGN